MKKTISCEGNNIYHIIYEPNKFESFFGLKRKVEKFKALVGMTYKHSSNNIPFVDENGIQLAITDKRMVKLNNFIRKNTHFN